MNLKLNSIKAKLLFSFLLVLFLVIMLILVFFWYEYRQERISHIKEQLAKVDITIRDINLVEKKFFNYEAVSPEFYQSGYSPSQDEHQLLIKELKENLHLLENIKDIQAYKSLGNEIRSIVSEIDSFAPLFDKIYGLVRKKGFEDYGFVGEMREYIHRVENSEGINRVLLLTIRRHEKDFLLRKEKKYLELHRQIVAQLSKTISDKQSLEWLKKYQEYFQKVVSVDEEIGTESSAGLRNKIANSGNNIQKHIQSLDEKVISIAQESSEKAKSILVLLFIVILSILIIVASFIIQKLGKPINQLTKSIQQVIKTRFDKNTQVVHLESKDEVGKLARHFEVMLRKVHEQQGLLLEQNQRIKASYKHLEILSLMGQDITTNISIEDIVENVYKNVHKLIPGDTFAIGIYDESEEKIEFYGKRKDKEGLVREIISIEDKEFLAIHCFTEIETILINDIETESKNYVQSWKVTDKNYVPKSYIYVPLRKQDRVMGVVTIQSFEKGVFDEQHSSILENLAVYIIIAIENAGMFRQLEQQKEEIQASEEELRQNMEELQTINDNLERNMKELKDTQNQLIQSEKMASLGQLIAGIAHEVNTPLGAISASISNIEDSLDKSLLEMPHILQTLSEDELNLFLNLIMKPQQTLRLSSREERKLKRKLRGILEEYDIEDTDELADTLMDMKVYKVFETPDVEHITLYLPLLKHQNSEKVINLAYHLSTLKEDSANIELAVKKASKIIFALKKYVHNDQSQDTNNINVIDSIETILTLYHNYIKKGVEVHKEYEEVPEIEGYSDELNQVWTNLLHNALQAMDYSGQFTVEVKNDNGKVLVKFADTGTGITEEVQKRIFEPFFTTKKQGEGTGLGLDIVRRIIEKHQGNISVESTIGVGTTFNVLLPTRLNRQ